MGGTPQEDEDRTAARRAESQGSWTGSAAVRGPSSVAALREAARPTDLVAFTDEKATGEKCGRIRPKITTHVGWDLAHSECGIKAKFAEGGGTCIRQTSQQGCVFFSPTLSWQERPMSMSWALALGCFQRSGKFRAIGCVGSAHRVKNYFV